MALHLRRMKGYNPRRSSKEMKLKKQALRDLEHQIKAHIGEFLVLLKEGSSEQTENALQKTKTELLKLSPDMEKIAEDLRGRFPKFVKDFLHSIDTVLHTSTSQGSPSLWVDEAKVQSCFVATQRLEDALLK